MITCRQATLDDARDIHPLLLMVAPEIPLQVDTLEREEALYDLCRRCARSGESWVAVNEAGHIVGFALVELNERGRHYAETEVLELHYLGVAAEYRSRGVFGELIGKVLARLLPVMMTLSPNSWSGIVQRLERLGFQLIGAPGGELRLRWEPGAGS